MAAYEEERIARELLPILKARLESSVALTLEGGGVHWHVDAVASHRSCRVHCFWYGEAAALMLGLHGNAHLRSVEAAPRPPPRQGAQYLIQLRDAESAVAEGRTADESEVVACVQRWLIARVDRGALYEAFAFVDENRRSLCGIANALDEHAEATGSDVCARLEQELGGDVGVELWVYAGDRSCRLAPIPESDDVGCAFASHATQLAGSRFPSATHAARAAHAWLDPACSLARLREHAAPDLWLSHGAELLERGDVAGWHWANVVARARAGDRPLADYLPVIERVVAHPLLGRYFSFTSLDRLCFSRCSHYPFATAGMPVLGLAGEDRLSARCERAQMTGDADEVLAFLADHVARAEAPFHGCIDDSLIEPMNEALAAAGSALRAARVQRKQWSDVLVTARDRSCKLAVREGEPRWIEVQLREGTGARVASVRAREPRLAAEAVRAWLEARCGVAQLSSIDGLTLK